MLLQYTLLLIAVLSGLISCSAEHQQAGVGARVPEKWHSTEEQLAGPNTDASWGSTFPNQVLTLQPEDTTHRDGAQHVREQKNRYELRIGDMHGAVQRPRRRFSKDDLPGAARKAANETVTVGMTAGELLRALHRGDMHVEIQAHLNVTGKYFGMFRKRYHVVGHLPRSVVSIRGNCPEEPPEALTSFLTGAPLLPRLPTQCLVVTDAPFLSLTDGPLWFDNVYMRRVQKPSDRISDRRSALVHVRENRWFAWQQRAKLWMTNVVMQGDGERNDDCDVCGLRSSEAMLSAENCTFADFVGTQTVLIGELLGELTSYDTDTSSAFSNCSFLRNQIHPNKNSRHFKENPAVIEAKEWTGDENYACNQVFVRLENCTFHGNVANHTLASSGFNECHDAEFYSDHNRSVYQPGDSHRAQGTTHPLSAIPPHARFLEPSDQWLLDIRKRLEGPELPRKWFSRKDKGPKRQINIWWTALHYVQVVGMWIVFLYGIAAVFFVFSIMSVELGLIGLMAVSACFSWLWRKARGVSPRPTARHTRSSSVVSSSGRAGSGHLLPPPRKPTTRPEGYGPLAPLLDTPCPTVPSPTECVFGNLSSTAAFDSGAGTSEAHPAASTVRPQQQEGDSAAAHGTGAEAGLAVDTTSARPADSDSATTGPDAAVEVIVSGASAEKSVDGTHTPHSLPSS